MTTIASIGHLTSDVVAGAPPRPGGGVFYSARALARIGADATVAASCAPEDREALVPPLEAFGLPVTWYESSTTTRYAFHYEGDERIMRQDTVGDPWASERALEAAGDAAWVHVGALVRTDFPAETLAALAREGRRLLVDAQGLVRTPALGPLQRDGHIGDVLRYVSILKLNDVEAETLVGSAEPAPLRALGVPEVILTLGSHGSYVITSDGVEQVPAATIEGPVDPTGAGDTFSATYLAARARDLAPGDAAREATAEVADVLRRGPAQES
jgi:sugar/nucleoside kinase (ribokinase family)